MILLELGYIWFLYCKYHPAPGEWLGIICVHALHSLKSDMSSPAGPVARRRDISGRWLRYVARVVRFLNQGRTRLAGHLRESVHPLDLGGVEAQANEAVVAMEAVLVRRRDQLLRSRTVGESEEAWLTLRHDYLAAKAKVDHVCARLCLSVRTLLADERLLPPMSLAHLTQKQRRVIDAAERTVMDKASRYLVSAETYFVTGVRPVAGSVSSASLSSTD